MKKLFAILMLSGMISFTIINLYTSTTKAYAYQDKGVKGYNDNKFGCPKRGTNCAHLDPVVIKGGN